eukprot:SM000085S23293  [mRNA]  locus=s85:490739:494842:- [translate_table: standard]
MSAHENGHSAIDIGLEDRHGVPNADAFATSYDMSVQGLTYKIVSKVQGAPVERKLLDDITVNARAGEILAVVGPSGAGKSTFIDALAGRIDPASLDGVILVNNKALTTSFRRISGYVMQEDALYPQLTVRETLLISARLRISNGVSHKAKIRRVDAMIQDLGLQDCAHTLIGNEESRGISGGERRRVSIGVDMVHDPAVFFLDEPTSGLDSTSALNIMEILNKVAVQRKRTIILSIHQPSFRVLELIHNFLVLAKGKSVYQGPLDRMVPFFQDYGCTIPERANILEFALDFIEKEQNGPDGLDKLVAYQAKRNEEQRDLSSLSNIGVLGLQPHFATNFLSELMVLMERTARVTWRTPELFLARLIVMSVTGLFMGSLFFDVKFSPKGVQQRESYFAFTLTAFFFTATEALPVFLSVVLAQKPHAVAANVAADYGPDRGASDKNSLVVKQEKQILLRETSRGAHRMISYVVANGLMFLPIFMAIAISFTCVSYFLIGLVNDAGAFFITTIIFFAVLALANSFVLFIGAVVPNFVIGNTVHTAVTAFMFLVSGFFIARKGIPKYWIWLHYLSHFKYPLEALNHNEFSRLTGKCFDTDAATGACSAIADDILRIYGAGRVHLWANVGIIVAFYFGYRFFFYLVLLMRSRAVRK